MLSSSELGLEAGTSKEQVVAALGKEMGLNGFFRPAHFPSIHEELLRIDEVRGGEVMCKLYQYHGLLYLFLPADNLSIMGSCDAVEFILLDLVTLALVCI